MNKVRIGIIGTGTGLRQVAPGFLLTGRAEITAICGSSIDRAQEHVNSNIILRETKDLLVTDDYKNVCDSEDVDLICVTTPNEFHMEQMAYALKTDKHVFLEKPVGLTADETRELASLEGDKNRFVIVGHQLRFNPYFIEMKEIINSGKIGRPYFISINLASPWIVNRNTDYLWSLDKSVGGGARLALGVHLVDTVRYLLGSEPSAVSATMDNVFDKYSPENGEPFDSQVSLFFSTDLNFPGCDVVLTNSAASHSGYQFDVMIRGEEGEISFDLKDKALLYKNNHIVEKLVDDVVAKEYEKLGGKTIFWDSFTYYAKEIVDSIQTGKFPIPTASTMDDAIQNMVILDAIMKSSQNGTRELLGQWESNQYS